MGGMPRAKKTSKPRRNTGRPGHAADPASARRSSCDTGVHERSPAHQGSWSGTTDGVRQRRRGVGALAVKHSESGAAGPRGRKRRNPDRRTKKDEGKGKGRVSVGILGVPLPHSWGMGGADESGDDDFDHDIDEGAAETPFPAGSSSSKDVSTDTRSPARLRDREHARNKRVRGSPSRKANQNPGREDVMNKIPAELMLQLIVR